MLSLNLTLFAKALILSKALTIKSSFSSALVPVTKLNTPAFTVGLPGIMPSSVSILFKSSSVSLSANSGFFTPLSCNFLFRLKTETICFLSSFNIFGSMILLFIFIACFISFLRVSRKLCFLSLIINSAYFSAYFLLLVSIGFSFINFSI